MYAVVVKPIRVYGTDYEPGQMLDVSDFPKAEQLIRVRLLRHATADEVERYMGTSLPRGAKPPTRKGSAAEQVPATSKKSVNVTRKEAPAAPPLRQSKAARARAAAR